MLDVCGARQPISQLREIGDAACCFQFAAPAEILHQRDGINGLLLFPQLDHALENLAMLRQEEIFRAQLFDGSIQRMVIEQDRAEDAALGF